MLRVTKDLIVAVFAAITSVMTAWLLALMDTHIHFALHAFSYWFIPVGGLLCGAAAASGYLVGFRLAPHRLTVLLLVNAVVLSVATYFLVYYFDYSMMRVHGVPISTFVSFGRYVSSMMANRKLVLIGVGNMGSLGPLNYLMDAIQAAGFAVGGFLVARRLYLVPVCDHCDRILKDPGVTVRASNSLLGLEDLFGQARAKLGEGRSPEALAILRSPNPSAPNAVHKLTLTLWKCNRCPVEFFSMFIKPGGELVGHVRAYCPSRS